MGTEGLHDITSSPISHVTGPWGAEGNKKEKIRGYVPSYWRELYQENVSNEGWGADGAQGQLRVPRAMFRHATAPADITT